MKPGGVVSSEKYGDWGGGRIHERLQFLDSVGADCYFHVYLTSSSSLSQSFLYCQIQMATLSRPWVYKDKWLVWPDAVFDAMDIESCSDTISGVCGTHKTVEDCIDACTDGCAAGYHVEFEDGSTVCVPIRTEIHPLLSPVQRLNSKSVFPTLENVSVSSFVNKKIFPFPPDTANTVFFKDILNLYSGKLQLSAGVNTGDTLVVEDKAGSNLQLVPVHSINTQIARYMPITYGIMFDISVPGTALEADTNINSPGFEWKSIGRSIADVYSGFAMFPLDQNKKKGDLISYGDKFTLKHGSSSICVVRKSTGILEASQRSLSVLQHDNDLDTVFSLKSRMVGYYCDSGICQSVPISETLPTGSGARYRGATVGRAPECWGMCKKDVVGERYKLTATLAGGIVGIVAVIGIVLVVFFSLRRARTR
jgi:hypothetical protein